MKDKSVLFVCTGNVFRSMSAEYALKKYLSDHQITGWVVGSAGTGDYHDLKIDHCTLNSLKSLGIDAHHHQRRRVSQDILDEYNIVVSMALDHQEFLSSNFSRSSFLFNELVGVGQTSVLDIGDIVDTPLSHRTAVEAVIERTVNHITRNIPLVFEKVKVV